VRINGRDLPFVIHVVERCNSPLLSLKDSVRAGLVTIPREENTARPLDSVHPVNEFASYNKEVIHLQLKLEAQPRQFPPRVVPLALQDQTYFELQEMLANGIIEPVTEPTAWCHPMLVTPKPNGRLRVCMDPRYLNEYLVRAVHPFPDMEQIFT
jgi:hypothetical protein